MKDTIIKETGNSRFLRSSVAEDITFAEFIALLRAGRLPIDLAGINEEGIDTLGMPLGKGTLLDDETETVIWGSPGNRKPTEALKTIFETLSAGVSEKAKIVTGTYTGNGKWGDGKKAKTISIGAQPKAVFVRGTRTNYSDGSPHHDVAMCLYGTPLTTSGGTKALEATSNGFIATYIEGEDDGASPSINESGYVYMYVVIF